ncbi:uncharacterized protein LOC107177419 [Citrus sinensis]|uniref:uncharacterized protein LOC107177419 n=1 Tax=Citrus sinensis TaxID=2711 RepID=UPI00076373AE|nr:uncharacterized protein LOC107177419 [Citrus sinensis]
MLGGDFNTILYDSEKKDGSPTGSGACHFFQSWFQLNCMHDLQFHGPRFTWSRGSLFKRLDRVICNSERASIFSDSTIFHLPKLSPDHRLILVRSNGLSSRNLHSRPFRFQVAWLTNEGFQDFVAESWDQNLHHLDTADQFRSKVTVWNKQSFGNIFWRKNRLLARLGGIQRALESYFSKGLSRLEEKLKADLEESCDSLDFRHYPHPNCFPIIEEDLLQSLNKGVEDAEVQKTIFRMYPLKAPGPDGFHAIFYQTQWNTVGSSLCRLVKEVFQNKHLPGGLNSTLLALIPKSESPSSFKMYQPISLCNVAYKTITKVIANRLQSILPHLVGPHQTSFVSGRHIMENIVIA